jgi:hypothetical protein
MSHWVIKGGSKFSYRSDLQGSGMREAQKRIGYLQWNGPRLLKYAVDNAPA